MREVPGGLPFFLDRKQPSQHRYPRSLDSILAIPALLVLHTIGMGFVAGTSAAIDLRILGVAKRMPLAPMERFLPVLWLALVVSVASGFCC